MRKDERSFCQILLLRVTVIAVAAPRPQECGAHGLLTLATAMALAVSCCDDCDRESRGDCGFLQCQWEYVQIERMTRGRLYCVYGKRVENKVVKIGCD